MTDLNYLIKIDSDTQGIDKAQKEFDSLQDELNQTGSTARTATTAIDKFGNEIADSGKQADNTAQMINTLKSHITRLMGFLGLSVGVKEIIALSDEFNNLEARLKLATQAGGDFNAAMDSVQEIANTTAIPLSSTADLFGKLTTATRDLGLSQSDVTDLTRTISQAMVVSGGSAESMNAAITQLAQGLAAGALRGDELNSVLEQAPRLATALADGMGVGIGELKRLGSEGKITAELLSKALASQSGKIAAEFAQMPMTVQGSLAVLKNNLTAFIGELDNELGASGSGGLANFIKSIADGIDNIDPTTIHAVKSAFSALGQVASDVVGLAGDIYDSLGALGSTGGEQVGFITQAIRQLNLVLGVLSDGVAGVKIGFDVVFGGMLVAIGSIKEAFGSLVGLVNSDLGASIKQAGQDIVNQGKSLLDEAHTSAMNFQSKTRAALDEFSKSNEEVLTEQAATARAKFDDMAKAGMHSTDELNNAFADYAHKAIQANKGVIDSTLKQELAQQGLQASIDNTGKVAITAMERTKSAVDKVDLSKHADSFKALNIDIGEFAGGLSEKATKALSAFDDIAQLAKGDVQKLAMAYTGAKTAIGDNAQAQSALDEALLKSAGNSKELTASIQRLAAEQERAKNATQDQAAALHALGVSMDAVNRGMSESGIKITESLKTGLVAIKEQTTSAEALKTALAQAFDTAIKSAQTVNDFNAIKAAIDSAGLSANLTSEQLKILQTGIQGGSNAVKQAMDEQAHAIKNAQKATDSAALSTDKHSQAIEKNSQSTKHNAQTQANAKSTTDELAKSSENAAQSIDRLSDSQAEAGRVIPLVMAQMQAQVLALQSLGFASEQLHQVNTAMYRDLQNQSFGTLDGYMNALHGVNDNINKQIESVKLANSKMEHYSKVLSRGSVSADELSSAQTALNNATLASINGINVLDKAKLDNLRGQIQQARKQMQNLADDARKTADSLEAELARMQGNSQKAAQLEQQRKLDELNKRLQTAKARQNSDEAAQLERAIALQRQIFEEQRKNERQAEQNRREQNRQPSHQPSRQPSNAVRSSVDSPARPSHMQGGSSVRGVGGTISTQNARIGGQAPSAKDIAESVGSLIDNAKTQAKHEFASQLQDEFKRMAR